MVNPIPEGYQRVIPSLVVEDAEGLIAFLSDVFGATERMRMPMPDGKIAHAELQVGDSVVMVADATPEWGARGGSLFVWTEDVDAVYEKALAAGARSSMEPADQFYGDRSSAFDDRWGNRWSVSTHIEDVTEEEMERRLSEWAAANP